MKTIIITGASSGIGKAIALKLAAHNFNLVLVARRAELLDEVAEACGESGALTIAIAGDICSTETCGAALEVAFGIETTSELVIINNAGIANFAPSHEQPFDEFEQQIMVNLVAPARLVHLALPKMLEMGTGQIINIASIAGSHAFAEGAAYCASKAGLKMLGRVWAEEYRRKGIKVTTLNPGAANTDIWQNPPDRKLMMPPDSIAEVVADIINSPDRLNFDELTVNPPNGIL